jgi:hypothetical protein
MAMLATVADALCWSMWFMRSITGLIGLSFDFCRQWHT